MSTFKILKYTVIPRGTQLFPEGLIPFPWDDAILRKLVVTAQTGQSWHSCLSQRGRVLFQIKTAPFPMRHKVPDELISLPCSKGINYFLSSHFL